MESPVGSRTVLEGREFDYFAGTGYLGLQNHPQVLQAAQQALQRFGLATATSRGGFGEHAVYVELERAVARFFGTDRALYFASGYMGMSALTQGTRGQFEHVFIDGEAHYSLWEAAQATSLPVTPFHHARVESLQECLRRELLPGERPLVLSDGIFPISGEIAPLPGYLDAVRDLDGLVYLDDAHAVGVLGENGRGTPEFYGVESRQVRASGTLAKAFGGYGGILWGEENWIPQVAQRAGVIMGASPPPLVAAAASLRSLELVRAAPELRQQLTANVRQARDGLRGLGWPLADSPVPILCLGVRPDVRLEYLKSGLHEQGIAVALVRNYTSTPAGGAIRVAIFATHTSEQINRLISAIASLL
jgi:glycine C-acetyltransferase/8-amino-7-oxononanoate synthase